MINIPIRIIYSNRNRFYKNFFSSLFQQKIRVWNWIKNHLGLSSNDIPAKEGGYTDSTHVTATWEF